MSSSEQQPSPGRFTIPGPAGPIEALLETPESAPRAIGVVCHPHPQHGGALTNKVAHMLAKSFVDAGAAAVRFNFRGVGASEGAYDGGVGETDDALAVLDWASNAWSSLPLWLAGFSFGGAVAVRAATQRPVRRLITVAPAVQRVQILGERLPTCPWLLVQGDADELVDAREVQQWALSLSSPPLIELLPGVDHFFHGRLNALRDVVVDWLQQPAE